LQTGNTFVIQLSAYTKQIQKQYRIQTMSILLSAVAITVELLKTLLQGRQETRFLVALLSGPGDSTTTVTLPEERQHESNAGKEPDDSSDANHASTIVDSTDAPIHEE
jgi:hypothetical protein